MALPAVEHLDPVIGVDVHAVIVALEPAPVYLPHPYVGFVLNLREYIDAALGVIGSIVFTFVEDEAIDYLKDNPDAVNELDHALKSAATNLQQANVDLMSNPLIAGSMKIEKAAATGVKRANAELMADPLIAKGMQLGTVAGDIASSVGDISGADGAGVGMGSMAGRPIFINGFLRATAGTHSFHVPGLHENSVGYARLELDPTAPRIQACDSRMGPARRIVARRFSASSLLFPLRLADPIP